jgi:hypothetical protein
VYVSGALVTTQAVTIFVVVVSTRRADCPHSVRTLEFRQYVVVTLTPDLVIVRVGRWSGGGRVGHEPALRTEWAVTVADIRI